MSDRKTLLTARAERSTLKGFCGCVGGEGRRRRQRPGRMYIVYLGAICLYFEMGTEGKEGQATVVSVLCQARCQMCSLSFSLA